MVGKTTESYLTHGIEDYVNRLSHYTDFSILTVPESRTAKSLSTAEQKTLDSESIMKTLTPSDDVILLDEKGIEYDSVSFARFLQKRYNAAPRRIVFVIGGPFGFSQALYERANAKVSLSRMTFSHQMVRLLFVEQLYRAHTIIKGEHYHHE